MSTPMTADQTIAALKKWGIAYHEHTIGGVSWRHHNRAATGLAWGPVNGFMLHHTADDAPDDLDFDVCWHGRSDLPGPLCQFGLRDDGTVDLIGCGRCNHAGGGGPADVFDAIVNESYGDYPPPPTCHDGSPLPPAIDGNVHFYGCETYYSGSHKMTAAAYRTAVKLAAAICDFHGWSAKSAIGHKEWSDWKVDPGCLDMKVYRADVQAALDNGPAGKPPKKPPTTKQFPGMVDLQKKVAIAHTEAAHLATEHPKWSTLTGVLADLKAAYQALSKFNRGI